MPKTRTRLVFYLLTIFLSACSCASSTAVFTILDGHHGAPGIEKILVLPLNVTFAMPTELEGASGRIFEQLGRYLDVQGRTAVTAGVADANRLWLGSIEEVEASDAETKGYDAAMDVFGRRLGEAGGYDAIVIPDLLFRTAKLTRRTAAWDGAKRTFRMVNKPSSLDDSVIRSMSFGGSISGASLRVRVYSKSGKFVFEGYGGIDLIHHANLERLFKDRRYDVEIRPDLLEDLELIREGIAQAFTPYFEPPPDPADW